MVNILDNDNKHGGYLGKMVKKLDVNLERQNSGRRLKKQKFRKLYTEKQKTAKI